MKSQSKTNVVALIILFLVIFIYILNVFFPVIGNKVVAKATGNLNDTGITFAGLSTNSNAIDCSGIGDYFEQDCNVGLDVTVVSEELDINKDGFAGFSFKKVNSSGKELHQNSVTWSCVKDNITGLMWEVKTKTKGLRDAGNTYSHFNTDSRTNAGTNGKANGGTCSKSECDTESFINAVNLEGLCSYNDWRLPTVNELQSIVHYGRVRPSIDTVYFPNTYNVKYWATNIADNHAWFVRFNIGSVARAHRNNSFGVRLVRDGK